MWFNTHPNTVSGYYNMQHVLTDFCMISSVHVPDKQLSKGNCKSAYQGL